MFIAPNEAVDINELENAFSAIDIIDPLESILPLALIFPLAVILFILSLFQDFAIVPKSYVLSAFGIKFELQIQIGFVGRLHEFPLSKESSLTWNHKSSFLI